MKRIKIFNEVAFIAGNVFIGFYLLFSFDGYQFAVSGLCEHVDLPWVCFFTSGLIKVEV